MNKKSQTEILPLAYYGHPILSKVAEPILSITEDLKSLAQKMTQTMGALDGYGLAAPQVHLSIRFFIIRRPFFDKEGNLELKEVKFFINPEISLPSEETCKFVEDCLSIPTIEAEVERPKEVTVNYTNLEGEPIKERVAGLEARIIQHEMDHLNGILYLDRLPLDNRC